MAAGAQNQVTNINEEKVYEKRDRVVLALVKQKTQR